MDSKHVNLNITIEYPGNSACRIWYMTTAGDSGLPLRFHAMWSQICAAHVADPEVGSHPFSRVTGIFAGDDGLNPYLSRSTSDIDSISAPDGLKPVTMADAGLTSRAACTALCRLIANKAMIPVRILVVSGLADAVKPVHTRDAHNDTRVPTDRSLTPQTWRTVAQRVVVVAARLAQLTFAVSRTARAAGIKIRVPQVVRMGALVFLMRHASKAEIVVEVDEIPVAFFVEMQAKQDGLRLSAHHASSSEQLARLNTVVTMAGALTREEGRAAIGKEVWIRVDSRFE